MAKKGKPSFPIVGIGASAGGLEALQSLVSAIPSDSGFCYVIVQHLSPDHPSIMDKLLSSHTQLNVKKIEEGAQVEPNTIFVLPSGPSVTLDTGGVFRLHDREPVNVVRTPIDEFFASLADYASTNAYCVVLSGTGSDGTQGVRAVKAAGGFAMVQDSGSARFPAMPDSAAATGVVDFILKAEAIPDRLIDIFSHREKLADSGRVKALQDEIQAALPEIVALVREDGHDFTDYKPGTLVRRIERRMMLLRRQTVAGFIDLLHNDETERERLLQDFLIGVTHFFRDPEIFEQLHQDVILPLLDRDQQRFRIWVPGCSTGEEVYSIAMLFIEAMNAVGDSRTCQIFGTDIDLAALGAARKGFYSATQVAGVSKDRLERFFTPTETGYQVIPQLREMCVFAPHNLLSDPPFSRLDLISCRNLLIYLNAKVQKDVIPRFHYALNPQGYLLLGPSETLGDQHRYFHTLDRQTRLFQRNDKQGPGYSSLAVRDTRRSINSDTSRYTRPATTPIRVSAEAPSIEMAADQMFLQEFASPYAMIDAENRVTYLSEAMSNFIRPVRGVPSAELDDFLLRELRLPARTVIKRARKSGTLQIESNIVVDMNGERRLFDVFGRRVRSENGSVMIVLREVRAQGVDALNAAVESREGEDREVLERELTLLRQQVTVSRTDYESAEQELRSSNEELLSMNEELQSSNEELETSREELQSINEELETINAELAENNRQLIGANSDLKNLFESTDIATLFLDSQFCLRRFTPEAKSLFGVRERDIGRPLTDLSSRVDHEALKEDFETVSRTLQPVERELRIGATDETYILRVRPYRTVDDRIDGCVLSFFDITRRRRIETQLEENAKVLSAQYGELESLYDTTPVGLCLIDKDYRWVRINERMAQINGFSAEEHVGKRVDELLPDISDEVIALYDRLMETGEPILDIELRGRTPADPERERDWLADYYPVRADGEIVAIGNCVREVSDQKDLQRDLEQSQRILSLALEAGNLAVFQIDLESEIFENSLSNNNWFLKEFVGKDCSVDSWMERIVPEDRASVREAGQKALETGESQSLHYRIHDSSGELHYIQAFGTTYATADGTMRLAGLAMDDTKRSSNEERRKILLQELQHRVKNTLATTVAIIRFSARNAESVSEFSTALTNRIGAIAHTHDVLTANEWKGSTLRNLVERELKPFGSAEKPRWTYQGLDVDLPSKQTLALSLAIHELATNAAKYGALSVASGHVTVKVKQIKNDPNLIVTWTEEGGPTPEPQRSEGFGSFLITRALSADLKGESHMDFKPEGLVCTIELAPEDRRN